MSFKLLLWHDPCSEQTAAPYFSICVICWHLFLHCPTRCSVFSPAIQISQQCLFSLYFNCSLCKWCQTLEVCTFTLGIKRRGCLRERDLSVPVSILSAARMEFCHGSRQSCWWRRAGCRQRSARSLLKIQLCIYLSETLRSFVKLCKLNFEPIADRFLCLMWASLLRWLASWSEEMEVRDLLNLLLLSVSAFDTVSRDCTDLFFSVKSLHPHWGFDGRFL